MGVPIPLVVFWDMFREGANHGSFIPAMMPFLFLSIFTTMHVLQQFADSRAHLMPGFRRVHITVAAGFALAIGVLFPATVSWLAGLRSVGLTAVAMLLLNLVLWCSLVPSYALTVVFLAVWCGLSTNSGGILARQFISGQCEPQAVSLLALGIVGMLVGGVHLLRLNEDSRVYAGLARQAWAARRQKVPGLSVWPAEWQAASATRHARRASASSWSRICRWQVGMLAGWQVLPWAVVVAGLWLAYIACFATGRLDLSVGQLILVLFPGPVATGALAQWPVNVDRGLCLPVERRTFLRQVGAAAALSYFELWLTVSVAVVVCWLLAAKPRPEVAEIARALAVSFLFLFWFFGLGVWLARYRSPIAMIISIVLGLSVTQFVMAAFLAGPAGISRSWQLPAAGACAVVGLLFAGDAYRRWLTADLD
jgi:hypothetical protein